jgi:hypothetical protein
MLYYFCFWSFPTVPYFLSNFSIKLKAEASQIEQDIQKIEQEINSAHFNVTRSFLCPCYIFFNYLQKSLGCLMLPCLSFRLREEEKNLSESLRDINKSICDIEKEVAVSLVSLYRLINGP